MYCHLPILTIITITLLLQQSNYVTAKAAAASTNATPVTTTKRKLKSAELALCGSIATMVGDTAMQPIDCIKTLQQSNEGVGLNMIQAGKRIFEKQGFKGFYSGLGAYVVSDGGAGAIKFATYEALKQWLDGRIPEEYEGAAYFGCAALAFVASSVVLVPGELLKQKLQMGQIASLREGVPAIFAEEGIGGFFHGYSGVCFRDIPYTMLELGIYDNLKRMYMNFKRRQQNLSPHQEMTTTVLDEIIAAGISGAITGYFTAPMDNIKTKLMIDPSKYKGFIDCTRKCIQQNGLNSIFDGSAARIAWLMPFTAIYLPLYEIFKKKLENVPAPLLATKDAKDVRGGARTNNRLPYGNIESSTKHFCNAGKRKLFSFFTT